MNNKDIEKRILTEIQQETPDVLRGIRLGLLVPRHEKKEEDTMNFEHSKTKTAKSFSLKPAIAFFMALLLVVAGFSTFQKWDTVYGLGSVVEIDVNPSVELQLNGKGKVIEAKALNADGEKILDGMDLSKTDLNVAINAIMGSMYKNGYINELQNSVLVSVKDKDPNKSRALQEQITKQINETLSAFSLETSVISQDFQNKDQSGKQEFIDKIIAAGLTNRNGEPYTAETLSQLNINELNVILNAKQTTAQSTTTTGVASTKKYIGMEKAKSIAFADAGVAAANVRDLDVELDYEHGLMIYEVDFDANGYEYDYDINAVTGAIVNRKVKQDDDYGTTTAYTPVNTSNRISAAQARNIAVQNAGVSGAYDFDIDWENGCWDVEFKANGYEYDYKISATGSVLNKKVERDDDAKKYNNNNNSKPAQTTKKQTTATTKKQTAATTKKQTQASNRISSSQARSIALNNAGVSNPRELSVEWDDGCWEVEFKANGKEYDYKISASGSIIRRKVEVDD
ncbi:MAG: PepSY domain-containing protein [Clostridia bacterium]|nr:PepSY domain-containing protein [Clostridia bacterium]